MLLCAGVFGRCGVGVVVVCVVFCCCIQLCRSVDDHDRWGNELSKCTSTHYDQCSDESRGRMMEVLSKTRNLGGGGNAICLYNRGALGEYLSTAL